MYQIYVDEYTERTLNKLGLDWFINKGVLYSYVMEEICIFKIDFGEKIGAVTKHFEDLSSEDKEELEDMFRYFVSTKAVTKVNGIDLEY